MVKISFKGSPEQIAKLAHLNKIGLRGLKDLVNRDPFVLVKGEFGRIRSRAWQGFMELWRYLEPGALRQDRRRREVSV